MKLLTPSIPPTASASSGCVGQTAIGPTAPAIYGGFQQGFGSHRGFRLYHLSETISAEHVKGSTVSEYTLVVAGYALPDDVRRKAWAGTRRSMNSRKMETAA